VNSRKADDEVSRSRQKELPIIEGYSHFIALPRLSTSPIRYRSASAARDAFERATSTWEVILFTSG
jgi:hypothetical protein